MMVEWTARALGDLDRLYAFLAPVAPDAAAAVVRTLARAPDGLIDFPRIGMRLHAYEPRDVRRVIVGHYELRYEIARDTIFVLRIWHSREHRAADGE